MTAPLLPHERRCPDCDNGRVAVMRPGRDEMLATGGTVACPNCDGTSVVVSESREPENLSVREMIDAIDALHREQVARLVRDTFRAHEAHSSELRVAINRARRAERECDRLRVIVSAQARLLDKAEPIASPSTEPPHGADGCGLGAARQ